MAEPGGSTALRLCDSAQLPERGRAVLFELLLHGRPARGFALRIDGLVVAYLNQCAHVPVEMDWREGEFLDLERRWIVCAVHGATYDPANGHCIAGPCAGARLRRIAASEIDGVVYWHPTIDFRPVRPATAIEPLSAS
jgi:nitrite reductase/ring-hydroxylating ferredoxin subunit